MTRNAGVDCSVAFVRHDINRGLFAWHDFPCCWSVLLRPLDCHVAVAPRNDERSAIALCNDVCSSLRAVGVAVQWPWFQNNTQQIFVVKNIASCNIFVILNVRFMERDFIMTRERTEIDVCVEQVNKHIVSMEGRTDPALDSRDKQLIADLNNWIVSVNSNRTKDGKFKFGFDTSSSVSKLLDFMSTNYDKLRDLLADINGISSDRGTAASPGIFRFTALEDESDTESEERTDAQKSAKTMLRLQQIILAMEPSNLRDIKQLTAGSDVLKTMIPTDREIDQQSFDKIRYIAALNWVELRLRTLSPSAIVKYPSDMSPSIDISRFIVSDEHQDPTLTWEALTSVFDDEKQKQAFTQQMMSILSANPTVPELSDDWKKIGRLGLDIASLDVPPPPPPLISIANKSQVIADPLTSTVIPFSSEVVHIEEEELAGESAFQRQVSELLSTGDDAFAEEKQVLLSNVDAFVSALVSAEYLDDRDKEKFSAELRKKIDNVKEMNRGGLDKISKAFGQTELLSSKQSIEAKDDGNIRRLVNDITRDMLKSNSVGNSKGAKLPSALDDGDNSSIQTSLSSPKGSTLSLTHKEQVYEKIEALKKGISVLKATILSSNSTSLTNDTRWERFKRNAFGAEKLVLTPLQEKLAKMELVLSQAIILRDHAEGNIEMASVCIRRGETDNQQILLKNAEEGFQKIIEEIDNLDQRQQGLSTRGFANAIMIEQRRGTSGKGQTRLVTNVDNRAALAAGVIETMKMHNEARKDQNPAKGLVTETTIEGADPTSVRFRGVALDREKDIIQYTESLTSGSLIYSETSVNKDGCPVATDRTEIVPAYPSDEWKSDARQAAMIKAENILANYKGTGRIVLRTVQYSGNKEADHERINMEYAAILALSSKSIFSSYPKIVVDIEGFKPPKFSVIGSTANKFIEEHLGKPPHRFTQQANMAQELKALREKDPRVTHGVGINKDGKVVEPEKEKKVERELVNRGVVDSSNLSSDFSSDTLEPLELETGGGLTGNEPLNEIELDTEPARKRRHSI